jgi:hypothetical protein
MKQIQLLMITVLFLYTGCVSSKPEYTVDDFKCYPNAVYLFRHAEKQIIKGEKNPELTKKGFSQVNSQGPNRRLILFLKNGRQK